MKNFSLTNYADKIKYLDDNYEFVEPLQFYREIFPIGSFQKDKTEHEDDYKANGILVYKNKAGKVRTNIINDDFEQIRKCVNGEDDYNNCKFAFMAPVSFLGKRRVNDNARYAYAMAIDIDDVDAEGVKWILRVAEELKIFPTPTYIVVSGNGIYVYYLFYEPIPLYKDRYEMLNTLKALMTVKLWNKYVSTNTDPQFQPITQVYRMPGTRTKQGDITKAYRTGKPIYPDDLIACIGYDAIAIHKSKEGTKARYKYSQMRKKLQTYWDNNNKCFEDFAKLCYDTDHITLEEAKKLYPDWYQRRIINKEEKGHYTSGKHLYKWWKDRITLKGTYGHRYFCILILVSYAMRCDIPYEQLEKDAYQLLPFLDMLTPKNAPENAHFTRKDVEAALSLYGDESLYRYTNNKIAFYSGIPKPEPHPRTPRRNIYGEKTNRQFHLEKCSFIAKQIKMNDPTVDKGGRPPVDDVVLKYLKEHPEETNVTHIAKACGVSRPTVYKYLQKKKEENAA